MYPPRRQRQPASPGYQPDSSWAPPPAPPVRRRPGGIQPQCFQQRSLTGAERQPLRASAGRLSSHTAAAVQVNIEVAVRIILMASKISPSGQGEATQLAAGGGSAAHRPRPRAAAPPAAPDASSRQPLPRRRDAKPIQSAPHRPDRAARRPEQTAPENPHARRHRTDWRWPPARR